ncbi:alpha/beta fold hydrolase [Sphingomonas sp. CGMCC 1.13654]|uniref:Alpha/beta fold hydrolase n=1 Tax=Sphingomonas chungangi TaxID=2683589 RepID=A0A838L3N6_9SPHN|nr:alpha/beta fold hydrolase [Sphingomonas chungangi]MBA2933794.1 alpha/beta fold hydrolase [Sphingomonas chungangi]MVW55124.1 alpha/beta fold hydrolase [Sphingomonas chungangi]
MTDGTIRTVDVVAADGVRLTADVGGPESAPAVILLHGGGQTRHSWSGAVRTLIDAGYRVINFDARGHGDSAWSSAGAYDLDDRAADLKAIAALAGDRFVLVGASLGGATAIHAVAQGLRPRAIVLVDIVPHPERQGIDRIVGFMRRYPQGFGSIDEAADAVAAYNPDRPRPRDSIGLRRNLRDSEDGRLRWHWDPRIVESEPEKHHAVVQQSTLALAALEHLPVLLVRGLHSDVVSDSGVVRFAGMVPRLDVVDVAQAGHMLVGDRNDHFNAAIVAYLHRHSPLETGGDPI